MLKFACSAAPTHFKGTSCRYAAVLRWLTMQSLPRNSRKAVPECIRVGLAESALHTDYANFCQVGRSVQVRFRTRSLPIVRWLKSLWFSIT
jgi:hypothetical protein